MKTKINFARMLVVLIIAFLWGGQSKAFAAKKAWVKCDKTKGTITFYYTEKGSLGNDEYDLNTGRYPSSG